MKRVIFNDPNGDEVLVKNLDAIKKIIMTNPEGYWEQGSGDGDIDIFHDGEKMVTLILEPNKECGMSLHYIKYINDIWETKDLLSLGNADLLHEVVETADEIYVSKGLFIPHELAWEAIKDFIETEEPSDKITWITPDEIPPDGNWA